MSGGVIRVGLELAGVDEARRATEELNRLRAAAASLGAVSTPFEGVQGPLSGLAQGRADSEANLRIVTDMWKQVQSLNTELETYYNNVLNVGNAYGYQRDQMIQVRQELQLIQSLEGQTALATMSYGLGRGYGMDPGQAAGAVGTFAQMGALGPQNQTAFMEMLANSITRGSQGGLNVMMDRFLPLLSALSQQQLAATPTGVNVGGIASTLTRFNQSGIPGLYGEGGARVYQGLNQSIQGATGGFSAAVLYDALAEGNPDYDYAQYLQDIAQGASNPDTQRRLLQAVYRMGPQGNDERTQNWRAVYAQAVMPNMDVATLKAMFTTYFDEQGNYIADQPNTGLTQRYGGTATDPSAIPLLSRVDAARNQQELQAVMGQYRDLAGTPIDYQLTGDLEADRQGVGRAIAGRTTPLMDTDADRMALAQANARKAYEDTATAAFEFNQAIREANDALATFTRTLGGNPIGAGVMFGGGMVGGAISGGIGALGTLTTLALGARVFGVGLPTAGGALATAGGGIASALGGIGGVNTAGIGATGAAGGALGGGLLATLGPALLIAALAGGGSAISGGIGDRLGGDGSGEGRSGIAGLMMGPGMIFQGGMRRIMGEGGPLGDTGLGEWWSARDREMGETNPLYRMIFGGGRQEEDPKAREQGDRLVSAIEEMNENIRLQTEIERQARTLISQGVPVNEAYDRALLSATSAATGGMGGMPPGQDVTWVLPNGQQGPVLPGSPGAVPIPSNGVPTGPTGGAPTGGGTPATPYGPTSGNRGANDPRSARFRDIIEREALANNFDPDVVQAIIMQESGGDPNAIARNDGGPGVHSMGLMQVNNTWWPKGTPESVMLDPSENIRMGVSVLSGKRTAVRSTFGTGLSPEEEMRRTIAAYNGSLNWNSGQTTTPYADEVEENIGQIKGPQPGPALGPVPRLRADRGGTPTVAAVARLGLGGEGEAGDGAAGDFAFMGRVELEVSVNGQPSDQRPVLEFGRKGTSKFARIINHPRVGF